MQTALHEEVRPSLEKHSWLTKANPPAWAYMTYNQEKEEQEVDAIKPPYHTHKQRPPSSASSN